RTRTFRLRTSKRHGLHQFHGRIRSTIAIWRNQALRIRPRTRLRWHSRIHAPKPFGSRNPLVWNLCWYGAFSCDAIVTLLTDQEREYALGAKFVRCLRKTAPPDPLPAGKPRTLGPL